MELHGRLGNQLFQFAALAAILDDDQAVPVECLRAGDWLVDNIRPDAYRPLTVRESVLLGRPPVPTTSSRRAVARIVDRTPDQGRRGFLGRHVYREPVEGSFDAGFSQTPAPVLYSGYFQNEEYFRHRPERVLRSLLPPTNAVHDVLPDGAAPTCAVVVRAGDDYVKIGWNLPFDWYERGATHVASALPACRFLVFSDLPLAAEAAARALHPLGPARPVVGLSTRDQLHLIAACDHAVVASSSFAWWGAWLGDAQRGFDGARIVVAPAPWIHSDLDAAPRRCVRQASVSGGGARLDDSPTSVGRQVDR